MKSIYTRLSSREREEISISLTAGRTFSEIADLLGRSVSTISREVWKNCRYKLTYRVLRAQDKSDFMKHRSKQPRRLDVNELLKNYVFTKVKLHWSPEEVARRLKIDYPHDDAMKISHEAIYTYIYCLPKGQLRKELIRCLRQERNLRKKRKNAHQRRGAIQDAISIHERPVETVDRTIPGHWEGDLLMGSKLSRSAVGTLVERTTRYLFIVPLSGLDAYSVRTAFAKALEKLPRRLKKSLTYDRGSEMAEHKLFTQDTKIKVYFADPHSPWQRGTNENTNGLIRQYFPKGTNFHQISTQELKRVQDQLNGRPRKALDFLMPDEVFPKLLTHPILR